ncbi:MAG TPA: hypothetical protein VGL06_17040 [Pseudonocardiaceae bacterium]
MSVATNGDYDDDLGHGYLRRPISVAQLLEREGYRPAARSRATRRALTGVAAGAVLALGAVVGSLLLNHASGNTAGDTLASGANVGDVMLSNGSHQQVAAPSPKALPAGGQVGDAAVANTTQPQIVQQGGRAATKPVTKVATPPAQAGVRTPATSTIQSTPVTTGSTSTTPVTPATSGSATPSTSANPPTSTAPATATPSTSSAPSSGGGGLLGSVTGTLAGTLNSVTQPVFGWFG